ncbi:MAG: hypothetical protein E7773_11980 [Sphingomonas sp.]|uniref:hypothetical protein n=1 Tax=Sphingomonas sp. TaxID=28214 RepID=UPI00121E3E87|nr:hypothetical protein [Sphingomonas sp.]THD35165.1 MAG: hypothetical protein E7773_11980 [Sphingomonas sp.]
MLRVSLALCLLAAAPAGRGNPHPATLVGTYDGGQMEMAAGITLKANGRFEYGLSYGALDEEAAGRWTADARQVLLTSDPVKAPRFSLVGQKTAVPGMLRVTLAGPSGIDQQMFDLHILFKNGSEDERQLAEDATLVHFEPDNPPVRIALSLDIYELAGDPIAIDPAKGYAFDFRFEPNDIGKVDFRSTPLVRSGPDLLLNRYGRSIRFRKVTKR